ncbi:MAG: hypothetical protein ACR2MX_19455 [Cyclobacteriaceae bacterium]
MISQNYLWRRWTLNCGLAEFFGIGLAAMIALLHREIMGEPQLTSEYIINMLFMLVAGLIEGTIVGYFQWRVLKLKFGAIPKSRWIFLTAFGAVIAWFLGMLPSMFLSQSSSKSMPTDVTPPLVVIVLLGGMMGAALGALWGGIQWVELRKHVKWAKQWIWANTLGWFVGLAIIMLAATLPNDSTPWQTIVMLGVSSGLLAGISVGAITGWFLIRLEPNCK